MSSVSPLLSAPGAAAGKPSRSASGVVAKPTRGFHVFRIDGYSWTKALPGGERITSTQFTVGGRLWQIDYYPNGTDGSSDDESAGSIALYLRLQNAHRSVERVRVQYKFSLLDLAGNAAYELPAETGIFTSIGRAGGVVVEEELRCGYACFITNEDLQKRRDSLLKEDCLAIRCDVGVTEVSAMAVAPNIGMPANTRNYSGYGMPPVNATNYGGYGYGYADGAEYLDEEDDSGSHKGKRSEPDDKEYIRRRLSSQRRK